MEKVQKGNWGTPRTKRDFQDIVTGPENESHGGGEPKSSEDTEGARAVKNKSRTCSYKKVGGISFHILRSP